MFFLREVEGLSFLFTGLEFLQSSGRVRSPSAIFFDAGRHLLGLTGDLRRQGVERRLSVGGFTRWFDGPGVWSSPQ